MPLTPPLFCLVYKKQKGSALFLILIAVVLFAALTYAITQSNRGNGASASRDSASMSATQLVNYAQTVENSVNKLLLKGCADTEISFENSFVTGYTNPNAPSNRGCHIFDIAGGGVSWQTPPPNINDGSDYFFSEKTHAGNTGNYDQGSPGYFWCGIARCTQIILFLPRINESTCRALNRMHGTTNIPVEDNGPTRFLDSFKFRGVYTATAGAQDINNNLIPGKPLYFGCTQGTNSDTFWQGYHFWYVLIIR